MLRYLLVCVHFMNMLKVKDRSSSESTEGNSEGNFDLGFSVMMLLHRQRILFQKRGSQGGFSSIIF